jgi:hypothetical protein
MTYRHSPCPPGVSVHTAPTSTCHYQLLGAVVPTADTHYTQILPLGNDSQAQSSDFNALNFRQHFRLEEEKFKKLLK